MIPAPAAGRRRMVTPMQDSVTVHMAAPPERVWALVSDVKRPSFSRSTLPPVVVPKAMSGGKFRPIYSAYLFSKPC